MTDYFSRMERSAVLRKMGLEHGVFKDMLYRILNIDVIYENEDEPGMCIVRSNGTDQITVETILKS